MESMLDSIGFRARAGAGPVRLDLSLKHNGRMAVSSDARHKVKSQGYYVQD